MSIKVNGLGDYSMATVYSILNKQAKNWWYHVELREKGEVVEARQRERQTIRQQIDSLKEAKASGGYAIALRGRHLLFINKNTSQSGYSPTDTVSLCRLLVFQFWISVIENTCHLVCHWDLMRVESGC